MSTQTQDSQIDNVNIHFVVPDHHEYEDDCDEDMRQAFNKCNEFGIQPEWISETDCNKIKPLKNDLFVIKEFKGDTFEKLQNFKCSIVSPQCLLTCFINGESIPEGVSPIYTTAMREMCICASGLTAESKDQIQRLVEYMGGFFTKELRGSVTHLIADSVMSAKYECAIEMKIPIMRKEWIDAVWKTNLKEIVKADDEIFKKYKCPVFMNLIVTSTNFLKRQKEEIKRLINDHGGIFMGALDGHKVRVVLASENGPISSKLKYAMEHNIACLKPDWVYESIKAGYALPFRNFIIKSAKATCSTPMGSPNVRETLNFAEISLIPYDKHSNHYINETLQTTVTSFSMNTLCNNLPNAAMSEVLDNFTFIEAKQAGPFLDGCNIYLVGFATHARDKLNKILNVGGATRFDDISDAVTHVIVGDENKASMELKMMKSRGFCPYVLNIEWLKESIKLKRPASEERFTFEIKGETSKKNAGTPASPLSKKNLEMLQQSKESSTLSPHIEKEDVSADEERQPNLIQQYLQETVEDNSTIQKFAMPRTPILKSKSKNILDNTRDIHEQRTSSLGIVQNKDLENDTNVPMSQSYVITEQLFKGLTFIVIGFNNEENHVEETIVMLGGCVVPKTYIGIPDYAVVPVCGTFLKHTVNEIVTDLFVEDCINQECIVDIMYYHKPLCLTKSCNSLAECVITLSMYTGVERAYLSTLATELGAICQDMFARKANAVKNTYCSTHLICPSPKGDKYNAAVRWKLPAVTAEWLKACADQLKLVDETPFLVGEAIVPERSILNSINATTSKRKTDLEENTKTDLVEVNTLKDFTPKKQDQQTTSIETPLINKRLQLEIKKTPQSPFHVSTPETPYGQIIKPNPSPNTRKAWVKWMNDFPDLEVTEPPLKRRNYSTPLSELKKQMWQKLKNSDVSGKEEGVLDATSIDTRSVTPANRIEEKEIANQSSTDLQKTSASIKKKLEFSRENIPVQNNEINMQIAQLDQVLQRTSNTPENRYSLSGDSVKKYDIETTDHIQKSIDSQLTDAIVWEDPDHPKRLTSDRRISKDNDMKIKKHIQKESLDYECELPTIRKFMLSGIKDRSAYEQLIRNLGGDVSTDTNFDNTATHLLCIRPTRNEKMLGSIASGKWILHCSYLCYSEEEGKFLDEEKYEWGNPKSKDIIPEPCGNIEQAIAEAAYKWRLKLLKEPKGPFSSIIALLLVSQEKHDQFKRLIEAGGGLVVQARAPYDASPSGHKITHCFVNVKQVNQPIDWAMLASKGILCLLPQYLSDYLTAVTPLDPRNCVLPEFKKYLSLFPK